MSMLNISLFGLELIHFYNKKKYFKIYASVAPQRARAYVSCAGCEIRLSPGNRSERWPHWVIEQQLCHFLVSFWCFKQHVFHYFLGYVVYPQDMLNFPKLSPSQQVLRECYVTHAQTNEYNIPLAVVTTFKIFIFRYVSQSGQRNSKSIFGALSVLLKWRDFRWYANKEKN
jgi:hypothetical protein